jgi:NitT/TauT family transport system ATP-binding protein
MSGHAAIEVRQAGKTYLSKQDQVDALTAVTFRVMPGEFVTLVGASGCGKSTVLSMIAGLIFPTEGEVRLFNEPVRGPSRRIGYMLQQDCLLDWRTVGQNIALGLEIQGQKSDEMMKHARYLLNELGLGHTLYQYPSQLSGGMRQRVALVRTLAVQPDILLLDEPFSALDYQNKLHLEMLVTRVLKQQGMPALLVTHDLEEALAVSDRILVMGGQPGTIRRTMEIPNDLRKANPLDARAHPLFRPLFQELWGEIDQ